MKRAYWAATSVAGYRGGPDGGAVVILDEDDPHESALAQSGYFVEIRNEEPRAAERPDRAE